MDSPKYRRRGFYVDIVIVVLVSMLALAVCAS